jgi:hypothetical protein
MLAKTAETQPLPLLTEGCHELQERIPAPSLLMNLRLCQEAEFNANSPR